MSRVILSEKQSQSEEDSHCGGGEIKGSERQLGRKEGGWRGKQDGWMKREPEDESDIRSSDCSTAQS